MYHPTDSTYHSLCYTSCGALAGKKNSSMVPPGAIDPTTYHTMSGCSNTELSPTPGLREPLGFSDDHMSDDDITIVK